MEQKHEGRAVSAAASFIATAIVILQHSGESVGIGVRTDLERSLHRLGPDHKAEPMTRDALRAFLGEQFGEEFVVDVIDNNAPQQREPETDIDRRFANLEQRFSERTDALEDENKRLRAELDAKKAPATPPTKDDGGKPGKGDGGKTETGKASS